MLLFSLSNSRRTTFHPWICFCYSRFCSKSTSTTQAKLSCIKVISLDIDYFNLLPVNLCWLTTQEMKHVLVYVSVCVCACVCVGGRVSSLIIVFLHPEKCEHIWFDIFSCVCVGVCVCVCVHACHSAALWGKGWSGGSIWFQAMHGMNQNSHHYPKNCLYLTYSGTTVLESEFFNQDSSSLRWKFHAKGKSRVRWCVCVCVCWSVCQLSCLFDVGNDFISHNTTSEVSIRLPLFSPLFCHTQISKAVSSYMKNNENHIRQYHKPTFPSASPPNSTLTISYIFKQH